ncbi:MAG: S1/P1 nuclease [Deltaproteobacteria bacterium]|nr:S1/P1 nuclease [Deltaproteobacteria bacterium]
MRSFRFGAVIPVSIFLLVQCLGAENSAFAWGGRSHKVIALIAEKQLTDIARLKLKAILVTGDTLAGVSIWHDNEGRQNRHWNPLHYVTVPRGATSYDKDRDCPTSNCIVEAISWYANVVRSNDAPLSEKRLALYFIVHLVGDIHQPLHVAYSDDATGSNVRVIFRGQEQNLHALWDTGIIDMEAGTEEKMAARLNDAFNRFDERSEWQGGTPEQWANESLALTIEYVYPIPDSLEIGETYAARALPVLQKRIVQAGLRLGRLLNETLK